MKCPSATRLTDAFRDLDRKQANLIRRIAHATDDGDKLAALVAREPSLKPTADYVRSMYSDPYRSQMWRITVALHAMNCVLGTYGVESLRRRDDSYTRDPSHEYLNAGGTYSTTLIYHHDADAIRIGSWGDIVERDSEAYE